MGLLVLKLPRLAMRDEVKLASASAKETTWPRNSRKSIRLISPLLQRPLKEHQLILPRIVVPEQRINLTRVLCFSIKVILRGPSWEFVTNKVHICVYSATTVLGFLEDAGDLRVMVTGEEHLGDWQRVSFPF